MQFKVDTWVFIKLSVDIKMSLTTAKIRQIMSISTTQMKSKPLISEFFKRVFERITNLKLLSDQYQILQVNLLHYWNYKNLD